MQWQARLAGAEDAAAVAASAVAPAAPTGAIDMRRKTSLPNRAVINRAWKILKDLGETPRVLELLEDGTVRLHLSGGASVMPSSDDEALDEELQKFRARRGYN